MCILCGAVPSVLFGVILNLVAVSVLLQTARYDLSQLSSQKVLCYSALTFF
jgi:hypothetical protein